MIKVRIMMNQLYDGPIERVRVPHSSGVFANLSSDGHPVSFEFEGSEWTDAKARKYLRNHRMNKIFWREHENGDVVINTIKMASNYSVYAGDAKRILGESAFNSLMEIEESNNSNKIFLVDFIAMDFKGRDSVVGNKLRFNRKSTNDMIDKFSGLPIHLGHMGFFEDWKNPIGNTVHAYVGNDGNPHTYGYIYPHGDGKTHRENLKIAAAQGLLFNYPVSMTGHPIDMRMLSETEMDMEENEGVYADVLEWEPKSMDQVFDPALAGSEAVSIINKQEEKEEIVLKRRVTNVEITMSAVISFLSEQKHIALSDFLGIESFKKAFDAYVESELKMSANNIKSDASAMNDFLGEIDDDVLLKNAKIAKLIENSVEEYFDKIQESKESVDEVAKANEIGLNDAQKWVIKNGIKKPLSESEILALCRKAKELTDFSDIPDFSLGKETSNVKEKKKDDIKITDATEDEIKQASSHNTWR